MRIELLGGTYQARSVIASAQRCLNLYIQQTPQEQGEPSPTIHLPTPGLVGLSTPDRAMLEVLSPTSALSAVVTNSRPKVASAGLTPSSNVVAALKAQRPLLTLFLIDTSLVGAAINLLHRPLVEALVPTAVVAVALGRSRDLGLTAVVPSSLVSGGIGTTKAPLPLTATLGPSSVLSARIPLLSARLGPTSAVASGIGKTLLPKALQSAMTPSFVVTGNVSLLKGALRPSSTLNAIVGAIYPSRPITAAFHANSSVTGSPHKHGAQRAALTPVSALVAHVVHSPNLHVAIHSTSVLAAVATASTLNGGALRPSSAVTGALGRRRPLREALVPIGAPALILHRGRRISEVLLPRSVQAGALKHLGRLSGVISPTSLLSAVLASSATTVYYTALRNFYIATNGNDPPTGTGSQINPWKTLQGANNSGVLRAGDVVNVGGGTYTVSGVVGLTAGGNTNSTTGFVVYRSAAGPGAAKIVASGGNFDVIQATGNYLMVDGLEINGGNASGGTRTGSGLVSLGHHFNALNNIIHDCGGSGIQANYKDWYIFDGNTCYNNARYNTFQTSGISIYEPGVVAYTPSAADLAATYHIIVQNNITHDNGEYGIPGTSHTDGNGIILDDFLDAQGNNPNIPANTAYPFQAVAQFNTSYNNGGRGVHVFSSQHCLVQHNIAYGNVLDLGLTGTERGDICCVDSVNCSFLNNKSMNTTQSNSWLQYCTAVLHARSSGITWTGNATYDPRNGLRSFNIDDATVRAAFPGANPLGGLLP